MGFLKISKITQIFFQDKKKKRAKNIIAGSRCYFEIKKMPENKKEIFVYFSMKVFWNQNSFCQMCNPFDSTMIKNMHMTFFSFAFAVLKRSLLPSHFILNNL